MGLRLGEIVYEPLKIEIRGKMYYLGNRFIWELGGGGRIIWDLGGGCATSAG